MMKLITVLLILLVSCNAQIDDGRKLLESHEAQFAAEEQSEREMMMQTFSGEDEFASAVLEEEDFTASSGPRKYTHDMEEQEPRFDAPHEEEYNDEEYAMMGDSSLVENDEVLDALYNEPQQERRRHNLRRAN